MEKIKTRRLEVYNHKKDMMVKGHIEYDLICTHCETPYWAKKINSKYCSNACRTLIRPDKKRGMYKKD